MEEPLFYADTDYCYTVYVIIVKFLRVPVSDLHKFIRNLFILLYIVSTVHFT
jgi:hypothetical protein